MPEGIVLGVDAGGTRARCVVASVDGTVLGRAEGDAANIAADREGALRAISGAAADALRAAGIPGPVDAAHAGVAGYSALADGEAEALFATVAPARQWRVSPDLHIAWAGGTGGKPGVVVIGGTGSVSYGRNAAGHEHRCGGWGHLLGDEGSAHWIGREALVAALHYHDGRGPETRLVEQVAEAVGGHNAPAIVRYAYQDVASSKEFARLAPLVSEAANAGDAVAARILAEAGGHLAALGAATIHRLAMETQTFPVAMVGGAYRAGPLLARAFADGIRAVAPHATPAPPRYAPVAGALILAMAHLGHPPTDETRARLDTALTAGQG